jgi:hypothetical protein
MGILNNDALITPHDVSISSCYLRVLNIQTAKEATQYRLTAEVWHYKDQAARTADKAPLKTEQVSILIDAADLTANPYTKIYDHLKTVYTNYTDAI